MLSAATDVATGAELYKSVPPYDSASLVANISDGAGDSYPYDMTVVGTTVIFAASDEPGGIGTELFRTVPPYNAASTLPFDINATGADQESNPGALTASGGRCTSRRPTG